MNKDANLKSLAGQAELIAFVEVLEDFANHFFNYVFVYLFIHKV